MTSKSTTPTIVLSTHQVESLPGLCDRILVLDHGEIVFDGDPRRGVDHYYKLFFMPGEHSSTATIEEHRFGTGEAKVLQCFASRDGAQPVSTFAAGETARIHAEISFDRAIEAPQFGFSCSNKEGIRVYATTTSMLGVSPAAAAAGEVRHVEIEFELAVTMSDLFIDISVFEMSHGTICVLDARIGILHLEITAANRSIGIADLRAVIRA